MQDTTPEVFVTKPDESHHKVAAILHLVEKKVLVEAVCFTQLTLHTIPIYGMFEMPLGYRDQYLYKRKWGRRMGGHCLLFPDRHKDSPDRIGRHGFVSAFEQGFYEFLATQTLRLREGVAVHRLIRSLS